METCQVRVGHGPCSHKAVLVSLPSLLKTMDRRPPLFAVQGCTKLFNESAVCRRTIAYQPAIAMALFNTAPRPVESTA
jgi:hypothetical protein